MPTAGEIKRRFHRQVNEYAAARGAPEWGLADDEWGRTNLLAAERLAEHILTLPEDDARFAKIAEIYTARGWGVDRFPSADLGSWLANIGAGGIPSDPDEFVTAWLDAERHSANRLG